MIDEVMVMMDGVEWSGVEWSGVEVVMMLMELEVAGDDDGVEVVVIMME